jgi:enoyl-CoA hydratase
MSFSTPDVLHARAGALGLITLNRPKALNALSLDMVRALTAILLQWQNDPSVLAVAIRGSNKEGPFGAFCAGGDIRFFHQAALAGDSRLEDFFTEEYALNHLIHRYTKPYIAFMDGIVMGGGMGLSQGAALRIVTERTQMAMPETQIGLFPDVGGGYFLSRCEGGLGEYLALTGQLLQGAESIAVGLADVFCDAAHLDSLWQGLGEQTFASGEAVLAWLKQHTTTPQVVAAWLSPHLHTVFAMPHVLDMVQALQSLAQQEGEASWAAHTLKTLHHKSPLMLGVTLAQIRRGRHLSLADDLRMERTMVRHCFHTAHLSRRGTSSETVEGIRALAVDKDRTPKWHPAAIDAVTPEMVQPFFDSPWPEWAHPLRDLT